VTRPLTRHTDARGVPFIEVLIRVTGPSSINALERLAEMTGRTPAAVAAELVEEEIWYLSVPRMRQLVRQRRAARRINWAPGADRR
jgi:hypothetical protein